MLEYDGTEYHGWQRQAEHVSVQSTLEDALCQLTAEGVGVGLGRIAALNHGSSTSYQIR